VDLVTGNVAEHEEKVGVAGGHRAKHITCRILMSADITRRGEHHSAAGHGRVHSNSLEPRVVGDGALRRSPTPCADRRHHYGCGTDG
jgi:hypothetical protein